MRLVQEMGLEFANALNAVAAAERECAKLKRMLKAERKLVQSLKQEKDDEAQMAKRKIEKISQPLAEAWKDVEYATTRADVAEVKREIQEERERVQLLSLQCEGTRQSAMRQVDEKELELANVLNAAATAESECATLRRMLEEEQKLDQRLKLEKDDEAQLAKRQIEEISQELADARKDVEYATARADVAENEWIKVRRELQEERELVQSLKQECDETRQRAISQIEEKATELANALNASAIAERECARLKRMVEEERQVVDRLILEKDDEVQLAKRRIEEISQELAKARQDAKYARQDADLAENEWIKVKKELKEKGELIKLLKLECQEKRESSTRQDKEKELELANALNASAIAERECARLKRMVEEERQVVDRLILEKDDEVQLAKRRIEEISQELAKAQHDAKYARQDADLAENEWIKVKKELKEKGELIKLLKLECQEKRESSTRQDKEKELELANALNTSAIAERECARLKRMVEEERQVVDRLILEKDDEVQLAKRRIEEISQELAKAQHDAKYARQDADLAENEWIKVKKELKEKGELIKLLKLECQEKRESSTRQDKEKELELANALNTSAIAERECARLKRMVEEERQVVDRLILEKDDEVQLAKRRIEEISQELAKAQHDAKYARQDADLAENEWIKVKKELKEKGELIKLLKLECLEIRESSTRQDKEKELELANALNASAIAERECARLKRMVEEERQVVDRLILEKDDEVQLAKRRIEEISQELAKAQHDAKYARQDADLAENEWIKVKKELKEKGELIKLLKLECLEIRESSTRQDKEKELELANALNASAIAERECARLKRMVEEERQVVDRLILEKDDEVQLAKRRIEEISQELAKAQHDAKYARQDADLAENEWIKVKKELKEKGELIKLLKLECLEIRESSTRQDKEKELELANALNASAIAERECARLKRMVDEERQVVDRLILEKDDEVQLAKRQIEEISQELAKARHDAKHARQDADLAEAKKGLQEKLELVQLLKLECEETRQNAMSDVEKKERELADALDALNSVAAASAESSSAAAQDCAICLTNEMDMAFGCGHMTCEDCGSMLSTCPICREQITRRIKLYR